VPQKCQIVVKYTNIIHLQSPSKYTQIGVIFGAKKIPSGNPVLWSLAANERLSASVMRFPRRTSDTRKSIRITNYRLRRSKHTHVTVTWAKVRACG
jgi:hypothetical protein